MEEMSINGWDSLLVNFKSRYLQVNKLEVSILGDENMEEESIDGWYSLSQIQVQALSSPCEQIQIQVKLSSPSGQSPANPNGLQVNPWRRKLGRKLS